MARDLALQLTDGQSIKPKEYDEFIALVTSFNQTIRRVRQGLRQAATESDPVTGLSNREAMLNELEIERLHAERTKTDVCLILVDIDKFRDLLEEHGAESGDQVLFAAASRLLTKLRPYDRVYRYGGDEFLVCLRSTKESAAMVAAAFDAEALVILSNVPGLLRSFPDETSLIREIPRARTDDFMQFAAGRMKKKVMGATEAVAAGVQKVIFADGRVENPIRRALEGHGTQIT